MLIITALLVPALVAVGALAFGVTSLWTGHQDLQRAADLGALAGAAATPAISNELPITGVQRLHRLDDVLDAQDWAQRPCEVAQSQLVDGRSAVANAFHDGASPNCDAAWTWESPLLGLLDACSRGVAELASCAPRLRDELQADLPVISSLSASAMSAAAALQSQLEPANKLVTAALATQIGDACASETFVGVLGIGWVCDQRVSALFGAFDHKTGQLLVTADATLQLLAAPLANAAERHLLDPAAQRGVGWVNDRVPQVGFDLAGAAPAVVTPRLNVNLSGFHMKPLFSPMDFDVTTSSTARRVIKSALVLPSVGVPGGAWEMLPQATKNALLATLGPDAAGLMARAGEDGWVIDPNVLTRDARQTAADTLHLFDETQTSISGSVSTALCTSLPASVSCPVGDTFVDRQHLFGPFMEDVWDATQPPPGSTPTVQEILARHADTQEPLAMIGGLRMIRPEELFGEGVWSTITSGHVTPDLRPLLSELMFIPALDIVPANVYRDGQTFRIQRMTAMNGLFKARLVK